MDQEQLVRQARQFYQAGRVPEAERLCDQILSRERTNAAACQMLGFIRFQQGRNDEALKLLGTALKTDPDPAAALVNYGLALQAVRRFDEALASFDHALTLKPDFAVAHNNRGNLLRDLGRLDEALDSYDRALALKPDHTGALNNRGNTLKDLKRLEDALGDFDKALALKPDFAVAWNNRGNVLKDLDRLDGAMASYDKALALNPRYADAFTNRGVVLATLKYFEEALDSYDRALAISPDNVTVLHNRGSTLRELKRFDEALLSLEQALTLQPDDTKSWYAHGITLMAMGRNAEALASFDKTLALEPTHADALNNRGNVLQELYRPEEAAVCFEKALAAEPDHHHAFGGLATSAIYLCDWDRMEKVDAEIKARVEDGKCIVPVMTLMGYSDDEAALLRCSQNYIRDRIPALPPPLWNGVPYGHDKIRVAYLSSDFRLHATSILLVELIERHDRERFEWIGISFAPDDGSALRARVAAAFDQFYDVNRKTYSDVAALLRRLEVDIAVDLNGHTRDSHPEILSYRPAPVQVNYLGFPGTMGMDFMDYIIADKIVLPFAQQPFYAERIVQLPDCYQPNDRQRAIAQRTPTRQEIGLPEEGFVFACFNADWKITAPLFDIWMRLLAAVPGSVLWLMDNEIGAADHLRAAAAKRGIDPKRVIFSPRAPLDEHLARHRLADIFLDTQPYNAHTTGSDALWAGLPLVTCIGNSFPNRVGASLLEAAGLPELVTSSLAEYEALALRLAREPQLLQSFRQRLAENRLSCALFDTDRYRRGIEAAYVRMWETVEAGAPPQGFAVSPAGETVSA